MISYISGIAGPKIPRLMKPWTGEALFILSGSYYGRVPFEGEEELGALRMHFAGWSQPLEDYVAALEGAGLAITSLREPVPDEPVPDRLKQWARVPLFLWLKARILK